jgi:hypothetical protein
MGADDGNTSDYHFVPCVGGHAFQFVGDVAGGRCPDGIPCQCGATVSRWVTCPTCGEDRLTAVPTSDPASP